MGRLIKSSFFSYPCALDHLHLNRQRERERPHPVTSGKFGHKVGPESTTISRHRKIVSSLQLSKDNIILKEQQYCSINMSNENHPPRVQRVTPIYSTLSYADIVKKELLADHQPQIPNENDKSGSHAEHTVKMPTENDKPPEVSCAAALRTGLPAPKTSGQNNRPKLAGECSSTVLSNEDTQTTHTTKGASPSRSTVAPNGDTSMDSSDQVSQVLFSFLSSLFFFFFPSLLCQQNSLQTWCLLGMLLPC